MLRMTYVICYELREMFHSDLLLMSPTGFPIQKLQSRVLHLHVFDYDRFSRDDSIGEVFLPLCQVFPFKCVPFIKFYDIS